jgi:hypothetical protein
MLLCVLFLTRALPALGRDAYSLKEIQPGIYSETLGNVLKIDEKLQLFFKLDVNELNTEWNQLKRIKLQIEKIAFKENINYMHYVETSTIYLEQLKEKIDSLLKFKRSKRGAIDVIGSGIKFLFGTMDAKDRESIQNKLSEIKNDFYEEEKLNSKLTFLTEKTLANVATLAASCNKNNKLANEIVVRINYLETEENILIRNQKTAIFIQELQGVFWFLKEELEAKIANVEQMFEDFHNGLINTRLITYQDILNNLKDYKLRNGNMILPFDILKTNINKMKELLTFGVITNEERLYVVYAVPLISNEKFTMMKAFPVPEIRDEVAIALNVPNEFVIFDKNHEKIALIKEEKLEIMCKKIENDYFCNDLVVFDKSRSDCLHQIFFNDLTAIRRSCESRGLKLKHTVLIKTTRTDTFIVLSPKTEIGKLVTNNEVVKLEFKGTQLLTLMESAKLFLRDSEISINKEVLKIETKFSLVSKLPVNEKWDLDLSNQNERLRKNLKEMNVLDLEQFKTKSFDLRLKENNKENYMFTTLWISAVTVGILMLIGIMIKIRMGRKKEDKKSGEEGRETLSKSERDLIEKLGEIKSG